MMMSSVVVHFGGKLSVGVGALMKLGVFTMSKKLGVQMNPSWSLLFIVKIGPKLGNSNGEKYFFLTWDQRGLGE